MDDIKGNSNNVAAETDPLSIKQDAVEAEEDAIVVIEEIPTSRLIYKVSDNPPPHLCFLFGMQQLLTSISSSMSMSLIVADLVCAKDDDIIKTQILSTTMFMAGISTFFVTTFGLRLPIFQGPSVIYVAPLLAMTTMDEFRCPNYFMDSGKSPDEILKIYYWTHKISRSTHISGSLMAAGALHTLVGLTGLVGIFSKYVGPVTIVPTILLVGLNLYQVAVKFAEKHWGVTAATAGTGFILAIYLNGRQTPLPAYNKKQGFYIKWYPLHQVFAILISIFTGWLLCAVLTASGALSSDTNHIHHYVRTDSRNDIVFSSPWFYFPYPGQFGAMRFSVAVFITCFMATILSVIDSIGDYNAASRVCCVPPPPGHAVNRGIFFEGLMSFFAGTTGACHGTVSYGGNIGAMGITKVVSRRTFQVTAVLYILCAVLLKISAVFVTVPYPVLGGTMILSYGIFIGLILSNLQFVDLNSTRNLAIIGISILMGLILPYWAKSNQHVIRLGNAYADNIILTLISNGAFVGGFIAFFFDNTVRGTRKDRGLLFDEGTEIGNDTVFVEGREVYNLPRIVNFIQNLKIYNILPIFPKDKSI
ncbi:hypothetical protein LOTGIDRAFT_111205 [Lottia gigantea]|uniref:SLC26A/SulP transporter domain-containing protein n=1 Tax=Lottia gigantea TaxID=225164 RepID=V4BAT6_LOTGI|nr:hypothetical protein LOTGIDRAFT_111205 [Lottia gigantea]ESP03077.1 hypothetical protein LOTGIDRAFT_111205 [Lottia gigantea]